MEGDLMFSMIIIFLIFVFNSLFESSFTREGKMIKWCVDKESWIGTMFKSEINVESMSFKEKKTKNLRYVNRGKKK